MKGEKLVVPIFILGMSFIVALAAVLITMKLVKDAADAVRRKLGLLRQAPEPMPVVEVYPKGDIPQPETSNLGNRLTVPR